MQDRTACSEAFFGWKTTRTLPVLWSAALRTTPSQRASAFSILCSHPEQLMPPTENSICSIFVLLFRDLYADEQRQVT
jgi:hypothetical protein